jgi:hypothetical protein
MKKEGKHIGFKETCLPAGRKQSIFPSVNGFILALQNQGKRSPTSLDELRTSSFATASEGKSVDNAR